MLEPHGSFLFNVWDTLDTSELPAAVYAALAEVLPDNPPDFGARIPHGYADPTRIRADVQAGLTVEELERIELVGKSPSAAQLAEGFCLGTPLRFRLQERGDLAEIVPKVAEVTTRMVGEGPVEGSMAAYVVRARTAPERCSRRTPPTSSSSACSWPRCPPRHRPGGAGPAGRTDRRGRAGRRQHRVRPGGHADRPVPFDAQGSLPLQVCDFAWIVVAWALLTRHRFALALTYYWGLTLSLQAMVQPTLDDAFPDPNFFAFWGKHVLLVGSGLR